MAHVAAKADPGQYDHTKISFAAKDTDSIEWKGDMLAMVVTEEDVIKKGNSKFQNLILERFDSKYPGLLFEVCSEEGFTAKTGESIVIRVAASTRVCLIGLGKRLPSLTSCYHSIGMRIVSSAKDCQASSVAVILASSEGLSPISKLLAASKITRGILLETYEDNRFGSESKKPSLESVDFFGFGVGPELEKKLKYTKDICSGIILAKELVNASANVLATEKQVDEATKIVAGFSDIFAAKIMDIKLCKNLNMAHLYGSDAASINPHKFVHLRYNPPSGYTKIKLALVANGSTYQSFRHGGFNLDMGPGSMGGSAVVLGVAKALSQVKPLGIEVHFIVAAYENTISRNGMKCGDILTASNGKTIEVNNIDTDEKLALADALVYACNQGVDKIVDVATLSGACAAVLGPSIAGVFTTSDELYEEVGAAAKVAGERLYKLPMEEKYWDFMKSGVADMVNTGVPHDGPITTALFLKQFVDEKVQWLHIDMAAPIWDDKKKAATGFAISTLVEWAMSHSDAQVSSGHQPKKRRLTREGM